MLDIIPGCSEQHKSKRQSWTPKASNVTYFHAADTVHIALKVQLPELAIGTEAVKNFPKDSVQCLWHQQSVPLVPFAVGHNQRLLFPLLGLPGEIPWQCPRDAWQCGGTPPSFLSLAKGTAVLRISAGVCFTCWAFTQNFAWACLTLDPCYHSCELFYIQFLHTFAYCSHTW